MSSGVPLGTLRAAWDRGNRYGECCDTNTGNHTGLPSEQRSGCLGLGVAVGLPGTCAVIYSAELCSGAFERRSERLTWCAACSPITLWACRRTSLRPARGSLWAVRRVFFCAANRVSVGVRQRRADASVRLQENSSNSGETQRGRGFSRR
ncbi:hypothetical protein NDU88_003969 [Pleurodeles waltl]|uniref:Uncharacterized protein n=1 Tax=Pleurodeles waltl TaxID=8319 RepID=A0AAV7TSS9_PLEWA|nr:hypothetical protein NDU88_003969 [Pleurodeles waltl]